MGITQTIYWVVISQLQSGSNCTECIANEAVQFGMQLPHFLPVNLEKNMFWQLWTVSGQRYSSKWPEIFIHNLVTRYGILIKLHYDQGRNVESARTQELCWVSGKREQLHYFRWNDSIELQNNIKGKWWTSIKKIVITGLLCMKQRRSRQKR